MFPNLKYDFRRVYHKTSYKGVLRKLYIVFWSQGFNAVMGYRVCRWLYLHRIPLLHIFIQRWIELTTGVSIPPTVKIGKGLMIEHFGGIVINSGSVIGDFCTISHCVTLGNKRPGGKSPKIGNNVYLCVGAKILGEISIGDNSVVGANAVVLESVPAYSVVAGVPAKIIKRIDKKEDYSEFKHEN